MQKINVICVGKLKEEFWRGACGEYLKRLSRFAEVKVIEVFEGKNLEAEGEDILKLCRGEVVALCIEGEKYSSEKFSSLIKSYKDCGRECSFIIGSSYGLCKKVKDNSSLRLSFSDMTFPHQLMRVLLLEQIYRAFMILGGGEYHK